MKLVEKHIIAFNHKIYKEIDALGFKSKNLYNKANYIIRQEFIINKVYLNYNKIQKLLQNEEEYKELPRKVSQQILIMLDKNWKSFFKAMKEYNKNSDKFKGRPRLPKYKDKIKGRNILIYTIQAISKTQLKKGVVKLSGSNIKIKTKQKNIKQVRIIPGNKEYILEVIYEQQENKLNLDINNIIGIDIGLNNLATVTSNKKGFSSYIVNGRPLKAINQYYNKQKSKLMSYVRDKGTSNKIIKLTNKRNKKIEYYLHNSSRYIINNCIKNDIGTIVIGQNKEWKQNINIGKQNNQKFVSIPHSKFIEQLKYKSELVGIKVLTTEESYTSKCSFLDNEPISKQEKYLGTRVKRGLFITAQNKKINADMNGACNIIKKVIPSAFNGYGIEGVVVHPLRITPKGFYSYKQAA